MRFPTIALFLITTQTASPIIHYIDQNCDYSECPLPWFLRSMAISMSIPLVTMDFAG